MKNVAVFLFSVFCFVSLSCDGYSYEKIQSTFLKYEKAKAEYNEVRSKYESTLQNILITTNEADFVVFLRARSRLLNREAALYSAEEDIKDNLLPRVPVVVKNTQGKYVELNKYFHALIIREVQKSENYQ